MPNRLQQLELRIALGRGRLGPRALVFSTFDGSPMLPDNFSRDWRRADVVIGSRKGREAGERDRPLGVVPAPSARDRGGKQERPLLWQKPRTNLLRFCTMSAGSGISGLTLKRSSGERRLLSETDWPHSAGVYFRPVRNFQNHRLCWYSWLYGGARRTRSPSTARHPHRSWRWALCVTWVIHSLGVNSAGWLLLTRGALLPLRTRKHDSND